MGLPEPMMRATPEVSSAAAMAADGSLNRTAVCPDPDSDFFWSGNCPSAKVHQTCGQELAARLIDCS